jgi:hypothetical protein
VPANSDYPTSVEGPRHLLISAYIKNQENLLQGKFVVGSHFAGSFGITSRACPKSDRFVKAREVSFLDENG